MPYCVASVVPGIVDCRPSNWRCSANGVNRAPVDSMPRSMTAWPLRRASAYWPSSARTHPVVTFSRDRPFSETYTLGHQKVKWEIYGISHLSQSAARALKTAVKHLFTHSMYGGSRPCGFRSSVCPDPSKIPVEQIIDVWREESKGGRYLNKFIWGAEGLLKELPED